MSITLTQDLNSALDGVNLKWLVTSMNTLKELTLVYYSNTSDATISSQDLDPNVARYNLVLQSGQSYSFQLQALDISNATVYSNILSLTTPYILDPPVISSVVGLNNSLQVILNATANNLSTTDTVEFLFKQSNNSIFWVVKNYNSSGIYTFTTSDNASIVNYNTFRIACIYQPVGNGSYLSPSVISNTIDATPSDTPNAPTNLVASSVGTTNLDLQLTWNRPNDFSQYSTNFHIKVGIEVNGETSYVYTDLAQNSDVTTYTWTNLVRGDKYNVSVQYQNSYGLGEVATVNLISLTSVPDAPVLVSAVAGDTQNVITWTSPTYNGQTDLTSYKLFENGTEIDLSGNVLTYTSTGLTNGVVHSYYVEAVNAVGSSVASNVISSTPYGAMSIVSTTVVSKTVTVVINPNGLPVQEVFMLAIDSDPNNVTDGSFVADITTGIDQSTSSNVTVSYAFTNFTSAISFYCVVSHTSNNSAFVKGTI